MRCSFLLGVIMRSASVSLLLAVHQTGYAKDTSRRDDVVVNGRLYNQSYDAQVDDPGDILGHGWFSARLHVNRVLKGRLIRPDAELAVKYFSHTYMSEDRSFRFHLRASPDGTYVACAQPPGSGVRCE